MAVPFQLSLRPSTPLPPSLFPRSSRVKSTTVRFSNKTNSVSFRCRCSNELSPLPQESRVAFPDGRRWLLGLLVASASGLNFCGNAESVSSSRRALRTAKIPESEYTTLPNGLKYYDIKVGGGPKAVKGSRVTLHYVAKWKGITFMTSRQGLGVTGGTPYAFDVGQSERGNVLKGLDLGVEGMRVGGQALGESPSNYVLLGVAEPLRLLIVPPELAYGKKGVQEIPPNATIEIDVELLAIKQSPFGSVVKIIEG